MWTRTPGGGTKDRILFCLFFVRSFFPFRSDEHLVHDSLFALGATVPFFSLLFFLRPRAGPRGRSRSRGWFGLTPGSAGSQLTWGDRVFGGDSSQVGEQPPLGGGCPVCGSGTPEAVSLSLSHSGENGFVFLASRQQVQFFGQGVATKYRIGGAGADEAQGAGARVHGFLPAAGPG